MARTRKSVFKRWVEKAQETDYFLYEEKNRPVEFVRPLGTGWVRVRDVGTNEKFIVSYHKLKPINELDVLAFMIDDNPGAEAPDPDEPQEEGDVC